MLRPGLKYTGETYNNAKAIFIPFCYATDDLADIEFTGAAMRVWVNDTVISRGNVATAFTNGTFDSDVASWTDSSDAGAAIAWATGGYLGLTGTGYAVSKARQEVTVAAGDVSAAHGLRVFVSRGTVTLRVGTSAGASDYFERTLTEGEYSLVFTPTGNFHVEFSAATKYQSLVSSIAVEATGDMVITSPYAEADLGLIRWEGSGDVVFLTCDGYQQYKIERYGTTSWSLVKYYADDGPFRTMNLTKTTLTPNAVSGNITLTASTPTFASTSVGALYKIGSVGQYVTLSATAQAQWSSAISVSGVGTTRDITVVRSGTWVATVSLQRSSDEGTTWADVTTYTTNATVTYNDALDNQPLQYRIGIDTGDFTSGTAVLSLTYSTGSLAGVCRVTAYSSTTSVSAIVLKEMGGTSASSDWSEGDWSSRRGFPTALVIYESRMMFFGRGKGWMSESDAYYDFDPDAVGNAGPINRSIGSGPVDKINWLFPGDRLVIGCDGEEVVTRQSFDEVITPTNFGFKRSTKIGSARVPCAALNDMPVFIDKSQTALYRLVYDPASYKYGEGSLMELVPEIGEPSLTRVIVQNTPDKRIHALRSDGKVAMMVSDIAEEVSCWVLIETDGVIEDFYVQPGTPEDSVYYIVKRIINGGVKRYREKWALESECQGGSLNKQADSFVLYSGAATTTITGLSSFEDKSVVVWSAGAAIGNYSVIDGGITGLTAYANRAVVVRNVANNADYGIYQVTPAGAIDKLSALNGETVEVRETGKDLGNYTVSGGQIVGLSASVTEAVIGLPYKARYKSVKLAYGADGGSALTQVKKINHIAPLLYKTHCKGLKYGIDFETMYDMPDIEGGAAVATDAIHYSYDERSFEFEGEYDTDSRLCLEARAPRPCTLLGVVISMQTNEG